MTPSTRCSTVIALVLCMALPAWGQQYFLYAPQPAPSGLKTPSQDGVLVQEIEIQKGDTLYGLSRKFSGRGMYYPQILLFNSIKNPNLIYPGKTLKVPVSQKEAHVSEQSGTAVPAVSHKAKASGDKKRAGKAEPQRAAKPSAVVPSTASPSTELSLSDLKSVGTGKNKAGSHQKKTAARTKRGQAQEPAAANSAAESAAGQKLFEAAVKAYRKDDCGTALELLDRYLADNSGSPLAADATLYKAECYLKMSAQ